MAKLSYAIRSFNGGVRSKPSCSGPKSSSSDPKSSSADSISSSSDSISSCSDSISSCSGLTRASFTADDSLGSDGTRASRGSTRGRHHRTDSAKSHPFHQLGSDRQTKRLLHRPQIAPQIAGVPSGDVLVRLTLRRAQMHDQFDP